MITHRALGLIAVLALPVAAAAQQSDSTTRIVDARINRYCHEPDRCVLRGALLWDSTNVAPRYPEVMRSVGIQGEVRLSFVVQPDGSVEGESVVIDRSTNRAFEQPALGAVRQWKFRMASLDRPAVAVPTTVTIVYAVAERCPVRLPEPLTSLASGAEGARLIVMVCPDTRSH